MTPRRRIWTLLLLALAALLASGAEASRTSVWESNPPAALTATRTDAPGLLASLAPAARLNTSAPADIERAEPPLFNLGDVVLVDTADADEERFHLGPLELLGPGSLRGPPPSYPETRVGGFELLPLFRVGASPTLSLWGRQACGFVCREVVSDSRYDPWGLCLGFFNGEPCSETADRFDAALDGLKTTLRIGAESTAGAVVEATTDTAIDTFKQFFVDPLRVGDATGTAIGNDAGVLETSLAVVQDGGRAAALAAGAGSAVKAVGKTAKAAKSLLPVRGSIQAAKLKGKIGEALTVVERTMHFEKVVGKQVTLLADGQRARFDFLTKNVFTGQLRVVEAKFGKAAELMRGQPRVAGAIEETGEALARGKKTLAAFNKAGVEGGSLKTGLQVKDLVFTEQRFRLFETVFDRLLF